MPTTIVLGGHGLSRAEIERLYPDGDPARPALLAPLVAAEARPAPTATAEFLPQTGTNEPKPPCGCGDCAEAARALAAAESEGMPTATVA